MAQKVDTCTCASRSLNKGYGVQQTKSFDAHQ